MRAALGAAGNMNRKSVVAQRRDVTCNRRRESARSDVRRSAGRRAGASKNVPPRIVGAHDETKSFRSGGEGGCSEARQADREQRSTRRGTKTGSACMTHGLGELFKGRCIGVTEGKADTPGK